MGEDEADGEATKPGGGFGGVLASDPTAFFVEGIVEEVMGGSEFSTLPLPAELEAMARVARVDWIQ